MQIKIKRISDDAIIPTYAMEHDAGLDLSSIKKYVIRPGRRSLISTGIAIELPEGTEAQIRPRSGLALKYGITVLNSPGTIDAGYRGEIGVILINHGRKKFLVSPGDKIAQMVVCKIHKAEIIETDALSISQRGSAGYGSSNA